MTKARDNATQSGLVLLNKTDFSTAASVAIDSVFSSTYRNYKLTLNLTASSTTDVDINWYGRINGSDITSGYSFQYIYARDTSVGTNVSTSTARLTATTGGGPYSTQLEAFIGSPQLAQVTTLNVHSITEVSSGNPYILLNSGRNTGANQFDGFKIFPTSGTISGTIRIYGFKN